MRGEARERVPPRAQERSAVVIGVVALLAALSAVVLARSPQLVTRHISVAQLPHTTGLLLESWATTFLAPLFWLFVVGIVALERLVPAREGEGTLSTGAAQDLVWFVLFAAMQLTIVRLYFILLNGIDHEFIGGPLVDLRAAIGPVGAAAFAFVVIDLLLWVSHLVRHQVPTLWRFHEIHHSQRSMNLFTDSRTHFVEAVVASTIAFVPSALLGLRVSQAVAIGTASLFFQRFYHANIRTNLGPLRYVLVTPQSHRVHHSVHPDHHDTNFGVILSVWDRLFRTQHASHADYPATGLPESSVPVEHSRRPTALLMTYARQTIYPFRVSRAARTRTGSAAEQA